MRVVWLMSFLSCLCLIHAQDLTEQVCTSEKKFVDINYDAANVIITGFFSISSAGTGGYGCGPPNAGYMQIFEAVKLLLNDFNNVNYVPGITFGMRAFDTCGSHVQDLTFLQEMFPSTVSYPGFCSNVSSTKLNLGILTPIPSSQVAYLAELAGKFPITILSPTATSPMLSDKTRFPSFLRTIPSSAAFTRALAALLSELGWTDVLVIYTDDGYGTSEYERLLEIAEESGICISRAISIPAQGSQDDYESILEQLGQNSYAGSVIFGGSSSAQRVLEAASEIPTLRDLQWILSDISTHSTYASRRLRGVLTLHQKSNLFIGFREYFANLEQNPTSVTDNPWFEEWFEVEYGCSLTSGVNPCPSLTINERRNAFVQSPYVLSIFEALFAFAETIRAVCGSSGLCPALTNMGQEDFYEEMLALDHIITNTNTPLDGERLGFDDHGDPTGGGFDIFSYKDTGSGVYHFEKIGLFEHEQLTMNEDPVFYDSTRNSVLSSIPMSSCPVDGCATCVLPPRPVSFRFSSGDLILASLVNGHADGNLPLSCSQGLVDKLVSLAAMEWAVNRYKQTYSGKLNGVTLGSLVVDVCSNPTTAQSFLSDLLVSNSLEDASGGTVPFRSIYAFVDDTNEPIAHVVTPILSQHMIPEIQVGSLMSSLKPDEMNPYFARAVPSLEMYATAISHLMVEKGWMHYQSYCQGLYRDMCALFQRVAASYGICSVQTIHADEGPASYMPSILAYPQVPVVVTFGDKMTIKELLNSVSNAGVGSQLQIISGVREWATDPSYLDGGAGQFAITFSPEHQLDSDFRNWLDGLSLDSIRSNVFLADLFEMTNECSLQVSSRGLYTRICSDSDSFRPYQANAPYIIESAYHIADQLHNLLREKCGVGYSGLCSAFRTTQNIPELLYDKIVNNERSHIKFSSNGEGIPTIVFYVVNSGNYMEFVRFNTMDRQLEALDPSRPTLDVSTSCPGFCNECLYLYTMRNMHLDLGDWNLVGAFSISLPGPEDRQPYICDDVRDFDGPEYATAMFYALDKINRGEASVSVKGMKVGGIALDHCGNSGLAKLLTTDMYAGFLNPQDILQESILAWLMDSSSGANEIADIVDPLGVAMVSPSATSTALHDYDNFFLTVQSDATVSTAIVKLAKQLGFRYIQLVYAANDFGRDSRVILTQVAQTENLCVSRSVEFGQSTDAGEVVKGLISDGSHVVVLYMEPHDSERMFEAIVNNSDARENLVILQPTNAINPSNYGHSLKYPPLSVRLNTVELEEYKQYLDSSPVNNVFFARFYMRLFECNLDGYVIYDTNCVTPLQPITSNSRFRNSNFQLATINSVYASVEALDRTIKEYCGPTYSQPCAAFHQAANKRERFNINLRDVNFIDEGGNEFRFLEREGNVVYRISQYNQTSNAYVQQGTYAGIALNLEAGVINAYASAKSECNSPCLQCESALKFSLTEGDVYLGGVFDVHGPSLNPFTCGNINTVRGYLLLEAFHYALGVVNSKEGQFQNISKDITFGGVGLDACSSQVRGGYLVSNVNNQQFVLSRGSVTVHPDEIDVYIGSYGSSASMYLSRILMDLEIPQISYGSTSTDLSDELRYPYFFRTVPANDKQVIAMLEYLNEKDIRYVQIVYQGSDNGISGRDEFVRMASDYNVCVAQTIVFPDLGTVTREQGKIVVASLIEKPVANTVVTFLEADFVNSILQAIDTSANAQNTFRFLGSESWSDTLDAIFSAEQHAIDSVTLQLNSDDVPDFEAYMSSKNLGNNLNNPWFEEYYQKIHNCYTTRENMDIYANPCPESLTSLINSINYQQDPGVVHVINSVYAAAFAIDKSLKHFCGEEYTSVCQAYRNSNSRRRQNVLENLKSVEFLDPSNEMFRFTNRESLIGYRFNALVPGRLGGVVYDQIGTYDSEASKLTLVDDYTPTRTWHSGCDREDACSECPAIRYRGTRFVFDPSSASARNVEDDAWTVVAFFDIHKQGVDPFRCGDLNMPGYQQFLSFFYSIEQRLTDKVEGLRVLVIDTCSNPMRVDQDLFGLLQGTGLCNTEFEHNHKISYENIGSVLVSGDLNTQAAARLLEPLGITYVSPNAMSTRLDHNMHLARTIIPISGKMKYIVDLIDSMHWTYVDVLYQESADGYYPWQSLSHYMSVNGICSGSDIGISDDDEPFEVQNHLNSLNGHRGAKVVIVLGNLAFVKRVLTAAGVTGIASNYLWILGTDMEVTEDFVTSVVPASGVMEILSLKRVSESDSVFTDYVRALEYVQGEEDRNNGNIPREWFEEFYQMARGCQLKSAIKPINPDKPECDVNSSPKVLDSDEDFHQDMYIMNTIAATYAVLNGVRTVNGTVNKGTSRNTIRSNTLNAVWNLRRVYNYDFSGSTPLNLEFNDMRWWNPDYELKVWKASHDGVLQPMVMDFRDLQAELNASSTCEESVSDGFCGCLYAEPATAPLSLAPDGDKEPRNYYRYDDDGDKTYDWPVWAIVVAILTGIGLLATLILFLILLVAYPKKGGTSTLGYMVIVGIFCIYGINFAFFLHATDAVCGIRRFLMGVVYTITFAPLLIKAIDNWRFAHVHYSDRRYSGISSWWTMLLSAIFIVLIQCIIPIMWLILEHPTTTKESYSWRDDHWWCDPVDDYDLGLVLSFSFVVFIILITAIFSALTYDTDTNNYESRWILFGCIVTAGCFLVWMIVTTNAGPPFRDPTVAISNFVNATLLLVIIPFRKSVLMCQARGEKYEDHHTDEPYNLYPNEYTNETYQLDDYDNQFVDSKPSEY